MKIFRALMVVALMLGVSGCCKVERVTIDRLEESLDRQHVKYLRYVEADEDLIEPQKRIDIETRAQPTPAQKFQRIHLSGDRSAKQIRTMTTA